MATHLDELAARFLAQKSFAVTGVSRTGESAANFIWNSLNKRGKTAFAVNPNTDSINGEICYRSLEAIPAAPEAVIIAGPVSATATTVASCIALGVSMIWMHRSLDAGSVDDEAVLNARLHGITVIDGACPMMYLKPVDLGHTCFKWWMSVRGTLPKPEKLHTSVV
jgi:predicted CoA-binding protein